MKKFIFHETKIGDEIIIVGTLDITYQGSEGQPGTHIWWKDENGNPHTAVVRETPGEVREILKNGSPILENDYDEDV